MVNLGRAWRRTFWNLYDNLGMLILANTIWLLPALTIVLKPAASMAMFYIAYLIVSDRPAGIKDFFIGFKKYFLKSTVISFTLCIIWLLLIYNIKFYLQHLGITGVILAGISFWLFIFITIGSIYIYPLLCRGKNIRYSYILVIDNFKTSLILSFYLLILILFEIIVPILGTSILAIFMQNAFMEVERRYNSHLEPKEPRRRFRELLRPWESA